MTTPGPTSTDSNDPLIGQLLDGKYKVLTLIGRGGMGAVYRARDEKKDLLVALKLLASERAKVPEMAARFRREAATGKRIQHPNVCAIFDSGELRDGSLWFTMELCEGKSLDKLLEHGRLTPARATAIAKQMLAGLGAAHQHGIAHRDIKPENVMLVGEAHDSVKLLDFGLASNDRAAIKLTAAGSSFGTPEYISPEMAMGLAVDARADIYSTGVVLFQMVTGHLPFEGKEWRDLLKAHVNQQPPRARVVVPTLPPSLDDAILRSMAKLPEERFPSASAMAEALELPKGTGKRWMIAAILALVGTLAAWWMLTR